MALEDAFIQMAFAGSYVKQRIETIKTVSRGLAPTISVA